MDVIAIHTPFIRLDQALKLANAVSSGAEAKMLIQDGQVLVNDEICTMRGKKLVSGDRVCFDGCSWEVKIEE
ncbi:MAG: RNA-binding S4 domain-containing protein [Ndongobacter sp.]|nr:RNA-binding S4 domain-containing protein [Ndongobacter sp.]